MTSARAYSRLSRARFARAVVFAAGTAALFGIVACGRPQTAVTPSARMWLALSPASFGDSIAVQQRVRVERSGLNAEFDAILEVSPRAVTLVGLGYGTRLFTLRYDGVALDEQRNPMLPREVQARDVLSDVQLALWPAEAVRAALPAGWSVADEALTRTLRRGTTAIVVIHYDAMPRWRSDLVLENREFGYRLTVRAAPEAG